MSIEFIASLAGLITGLGVSAVVYIIIDAVSGAARNSGR